MTARARKLPAVQSRNSTDATVATLRALERKILWLSAWMIHHANHIRPSQDGLKVGGHQASCASLVSVMTVLFMHILRPQDRVAVKPHAAPVFHAIQYLLGRQDLQQLIDFRAFGGAQAYPSRTKDHDGVDFSTGSVGLGVAATLFASIVQDYLRTHDLVDTSTPPGRMVALMGDAELDEGNVFEALLEGWKHDVRNLWWVSDYNRQSLDGTVNDNLFQKITAFFENVGWKVINIKYGKLLEQAFSGPAGEALKQWIDACPNQLYSALTFKGHGAWRERLKRDLAGTKGLGEFLDSHDDDALHRLMTNLGGHDLETLIKTFEGVTDERPHCFIAYTIKGWGLPLAGHRDNHAGLMTPSQMEEFRKSNHVAAGHEWEPLAGIDDKKKVEAFIANVPWKQKPLETDKRPLVLKPRLEIAPTKQISTQAAFGNSLNGIAGEGGELARRIVTTSPDVAVSTNLSAWINKRGVFNRAPRSDVFQDEKIASPLKWFLEPKGQHIELGIAENNFFLMLCAAGLSESLFGSRLLPIGTVYDTFISRGLDALNYAVYQDARFMMAGTPSGTALAPEGGAHQSLITPLIGMSLPNLVSFEPAFADELAVIMQWGFAHMQRATGSSVYLRLSTRSIGQPQRAMSPTLGEEITRGGYWLKAPAPEAKTIIAYTGAVAPEAIAAHAVLSERQPGAGLLAITSLDRLHADWLDNAENSHVATLLAAAPRAAIVSVIDGHPASMSWLGAVRGQRIRPLGVSGFGQSANIPDLFAHHGIDANAIVEAADRLAF
jgi:pyruvate dehydrogenase E1 component